MYPFNRFDGIWKNFDLDVLFDPTVSYRNVVKTHDEDNYYLEISVPGVSKENIKISSNGRKLTIVVDFGENNKFAKGEETYSYKLGELMNIDELKASLKDGILNVTIPFIKEASEDRTFEIE